jgi:hypothetical protein
MARFISIFSDTSADKRGGLSNHFWPMTKGIMRTFGIAWKGFCLALFLAMGAGLLSGCQMESADADLPPVNLNPPAVAQAAPLPPVVALPSRVYSAPAPAAVREVPAPAYSSAVPAGWVPPVAPRHWTWIIIHHSDSAYGSAAIIDQWHRARGFDELGYHFVIGNGTNSGDGQIEVGPRWTKQKWGAHDNALDNRYNIYGIGICLVGDFNKTRPTPRQMRSLVKLVAYLMETYNIPASRVLGHGQTKVTECPGRNLNVASVREQAERLVADGNIDFNADYADQR